MLYMSIVSMALLVLHGEHLNDAQSVLKALLVPGFVQVNNRSWWTFFFLDVSNGGAAVGVVCARERACGAAGGCSQPSTVAHGPFFVSLGDVTASNLKARVKHVEIECEDTAAMMLLVRSVVKVTLGHMRRFPPETGPAFCERITGAGPPNGQVFPSSSTRGAPQPPSAACATVVVRVVCTS
jgi:hypothetical protein